MLLVSLHRDIEIKNGFGKTLDKQELRFKKLHHDIRVWWGYKQSFEERARLKEEALK
ncbi:hypothetical protein KJ891_03690 [Candidatus Micrarchaeota archaeon]|nr:hypothetical protein [Candidatus Micrarchaeota archaeon]